MYTKYPIPTTACTALADSESEGLTLTFERLLRVFYVKQKPVFGIQND